jgi:NTP pyrophosphatase (non-canonical NTP hydrolase)
MTYSETLNNEEYLHIIKEDVDHLSNLCYQLAVEAGWNEPDKTLENRHEINTALVLIHSEISEAAEGVRKDLMDDHLPHRKMVEVELADAFIRIANLAGYMGLDLGGAVAQKLLYNTKRLDHKEEAKKQAGGKAY